MQGETAMQHLINIHFFSEKLGRLASKRPGMLYFVFNADVVTVLVAHTIREGEFVAQVSACNDISPYHIPVALCYGGFLCDAECSPIDPPIPPPRCPTSLRFSHQRTSKALTAYGRSRRPPA